MLAQIEQAFEQRRQSEERLRRFVSDASHELRTPLTSVRGFAELFHRGAASRPDDLALAMSRIESEAERMGVIVEDLLLLANLDQGRPLGQERFDLEAVLAEMVADHAMLHADWPISFSSSGGSDLVGDELRIRQAVANLLANARAHTPPGTSIAVALATVGDDRTVEVSDNGPGIAADDLPHLFERFYRVDASRARRSGGSGLGLAIVQAIAEAHGGSVGVDQRRGRGRGVHDRAADRGRDGGNPQGHGSGFSLTYSTHASRWLLLRGSVRSDQQVDRLGRVGGLRASFRSPAAGRWSDPPAAARRGGRAGARPGPAPASARPAVPRSRSRDAPPASSCPAPRSRSSARPPAAPAVATAWPWSSGW